MPKKDGWEKYDDYVWRKKVGSGYKYIWISSNNTVRVVDWHSAKRPYPSELTQESYVLHRYRTLRDATNFVRKFKRIH